ncbi:MAG TPA: hypothetical protein VK747_04195 [Blastocatellia bacterium]|nr:hypothetical protein [Blastocatellia bacterium]
MKILFTIGIALLLLSAYPLYLMAMELKTSNAAYERYEVSQHSGKNYQYKSADFYGHDIELSDARLVGPAKAGDNLEVIVSTTVDGKDHTLDSPIEVEIFKGTKSYNGWIAILTLKDKQLQQERLAIIQRVAGQHYPDDTRYRILFVQPDGTVTEEWFSYPERANPMYRTVLATFAHPEQLGFHSQVLMYWPTILYPIIYPWLSGLAGLLLSIIGGIFILRGRRVQINEA